MGRGPHRSRNGWYAHKHNVKRRRHWGKNLAKAHIASAQKHMIAPADNDDVINDVHASSEPAYDDANAVTPPMSEPGQRNRTERRGYHPHILLGALREQQN